MARDEAWKSSGIFRFINYIIGFIKDKVAQPNNHSIITNPKPYEPIDNGDNGDKAAAKYQFEAEISQDAFGHFWVSRTSPGNRIYNSGDRMTDRLVCSIERAEQRHG